MNLLWTQWVAIGVLLCAFTLQLYRLDARTFHGDEFGSLDEALLLGKNANSLPYFASLRMFLLGGDGEFWTRALSVFCAVLAIAVTFRWVSRATSSRLARWAVLLLATSPFLLVYAQQVRFYAFALLAASFSIWAFVEWMKLSPKRFLLWLGAAVFAVAALFLNALAILAQAVTAFWLMPRWKRRTKILALAGAAAVVALVVLIPAVRTNAFNALAAYTNAESRYETSRGLALANLAKIPLTLYFFTFGEAVYPLHLWLVIPGLIFFGAAAVLGIVYLKRFPKIFVFVITAFVLGLGLLYLVFDPLAPPTLQGAAPRYLIFLLPVFYLVVAAGTLFAKTRWLIIPLLFVNFAGLALYWQSDWSYTDDLVDWRAMGQSVAQQMDAQTDVVADGRAYALTRRYVPENIPVFKFSEYAPRAETSRIILLTYDYHAERRADADAFLENVRGDFELTSSWGQFPAFVFVLNRRAAPQKNFTVNTQTGRIETMPEEFGLEFQDTRLPLNANVNGNVVALSAPFALDKTKTLRIFPLAQPTNAQTLWLLSQVLDTNGGAGAAVATLRVYFDDDSVQSVPIRLGEETGAWDGACRGACRPVASWRKRAALLGAQAYPDSWREFDAHVFAAPLALHPNARITKIDLVNAQDSGALYVWGMFLK